MKKNFWSRLRAFLASYLLFFLLCAYVVTCSFLLFFRAIELSEAQIRQAAPLTFMNILLLAGGFLIIDIVRRRLTIDRPVKMIKDALDQITKGDFSVRLSPRGSNADIADIMESVNKTAEELSGVETLRTDFIANVSHEMKTPLAVIQNYGTLLQTPGLPEEKRQEYARAVTESSRRMADLVTNILKLNRLENQRIYPQAEPYNLSEQLCTCLLRFESLWEAKKINIEADIQEEVVIRADAELLALVWNNLLSNAFKFTPDGGSVSLTLKADEGWSTISVADSGCGMTPEVGAHIFEKFYQGDPSHAAQGNGLGLALVKRIIDIVDGEISVKSEPGRGSVFTVRIKQ